MIKNKDINRGVPDWKRKDARRDIVTSLLRIRNIKNIQLTETSLHSEWVNVFSSEENKKRRIRSENFIKNHLQPYYNLVSIWEYLRKAQFRPETYRNVLTDDFSGKQSPAWQQIGKMAKSINVIPKGDQTYPLLSLADLVMELVKQEVEVWDSQEIYEYLREHTPDDSAWIDSDEIDSQGELQMIAPHTTHNINTSPHYPHPTVYIDSGSQKSDNITSLDFFRHATKFAKDEGGCVKFYEENQDRDYLTSADYLVSMDRSDNPNPFIESFNDYSKPEVISAEDAMELFSS